MTPEEIAAEAARVAAEAAAQTPEQAAAAEAAARQTNADNAARRLLETAQARVKELEDAETERKRGELSEIERLKQETADAKRELEAARLDRLRLTAGKDLPAEALEFLTGTDEAALTAQAEKLRRVYAPQAAGTHTNPPANQGPTIDERIAAAEKAGDRTLSIQLKREKTFGVKS